MFAKKIVVALAVVVATGSAFAQAQPMNNASATPAVSRDQVRAELIEAQKNGTASLNQSDAMIGQPTQPFTSTKTRAQVKQELAAAVANGSMSHSDGNAEDYPHQQAFVSTRTRQEVRAEATLARNTVHAPNEQLYSGN